MVKELEMDPALSYTTKYFNMTPLIILTRFRRFLHFFLSTLLHNRYREKELYNFKFYTGELFLEIALNTSKERLCVCRLQL